VAGLATYLTARPPVSRLENASNEWLKWCIAVVEQSGTTDFISTGAMAALCVRLKLLTVAATAE
jgi:hypothetical protein